MGIIDWIIDGKFLENLHRGGLQMPFDNAVIISEIFSLNMVRKHGVTLENILYKNFYLFESPKRSKEPALKVMIIQRFL